MKKLITVILFSCFILTVFSQEVIFEDDFENGNFKPQWFLNPGINGIIDVVNGAGINNSYGVRMGKSFDGNDFTTNALDLHLDLTNETDVELTFFIAGQFDETQVDDGIYFSDNGGNTFKKVVDFFPHEWCSGVYGQHPPIDVDGLATNAELELTDEFVIRFQQTGQNDFSGTNPSNQDGFYLDNVNVYDPELIYATLPFTDDFNTNTLKKAWAWNFADSTATIATGNSITNPMSFVGTLNQVGIDGTPGVLIGRICDGTFTTNALDLHLNLLSQTDVELTFWITDQFDETQVDDGIYFSDNGGITFEKVVDFFPDLWSNGVYEEYPPIDVDGIVALNENLELTSEFVIRFQQTGQSDFGGTNPGNQDGFYLDNVNVTGMTTSISALNYSDLVNIYPNPSSSSIVIDVNGASSQIDVVEIINMNGSSVLKTNSYDNAEELDVSLIPKGIYIISVIFNDGKIINKKMIKDN